MTLDEIVLHNFGLYRGQQHIVLAPPSKDKPIVLFGGLNGRGKTTLLDAIQLVLYGKRANCSNKGKMAYHDFLRSSIHRGVQPSEGASLELTFRHHQEGTEHTYHIKRSWWLSERGALTERMEVSLDGVVSQPLTERWDEHVEEFIPLGISSLFFFDGEKIEQLADPATSAAQLAVAMQTLLGLDLIDRLDDDLIALARRQKTELANDKDRKRIEQAQAELVQVEQRIAELVQKQADSKEALRKAKSTLSDAEDKFRFAGGELYEQRDELEQQRRLVNERVEVVERQLREIASGIAPLMLVEGLLLDVAKQAELEEQLEVQSLLQDTLKARDARLLAQLSQRPGVDDTLLQTLGALLSDDLKANTPPPAEPYLELSRKGRQQLAHLLEHDFPQTQAQSGELTLALEALREEQVNLERKMAGIPTRDQLMRLMNEREQARGALKAAEEAMAALAQEATKAEKELDERKRRLTALLDKQVEIEHEAESKTRIIAHSARVQKTLTVFRQRVLQRHIERIEMFVLESLLRLYQKKGLISRVVIDSVTFTVSLRDKHGQDLPAERLSAGERQLLATSLLWGLARASGRLLPTIIDTPLGRLDSRHRKRLVEHYFPYASHQVLLLSTDEEINERTLERLRPWIGRQYHLRYDEAAQRTIVEEGYFKEEG